MNNSLLISGVGGRMGRMLVAKAAEQGFAVVAGLDSKACADFPFPVFQEVDAISASPDVVIDFSSPPALPGLLRYLEKNRLPAVLGTTGYSDEQMRMIHEAARTLPLFQSPNMSRGVYVLHQLAKEAARLLVGFDIEIVEKHHRNKVDSPSGTALSLLKAVARTDSQPVYGREGKHCKRSDVEIGVHALRGGTVAGEHELGFYGQEESLLLVHQAQSRAVFASGALAAARWLLGQAPGLYGMKDLMEG